MDEHTGIPHLREIVIFLVASSIVVPLFHRVRVSPVLGYLVVGGLIGPFGLGLLARELHWLSYVVIDDIEGVRPLAELGVIFLLFAIGLELSFERLWALRRLVFGLGSLQVVVSAVVIGAIAWGWGNTPRASMILGTCLALSSTAVVMQLLAEKHRLGTLLGRSSFSILLFQDLAVVPILFMLGVFGAQAMGGAMAAGLGLAQALLEAALVIGGIYLVGRAALRPLFQLVSRSRSPEMFMAAILLVAIGASAITGAAGLSMALGAFLAGLLLAGTEFRHAVEVDVEPFKGLLLGLFFMTVGMGIDYRVIVDEALWITASVIGLFAVKALITGVLSLAFGLPRHVALEAGLLLGQGGEFAFVVVGLAMSLGLMPTDTGHFMLIVASLSMMLTPLVAVVARRLSARLEHGQAHRLSQSAEEAQEGHVIIAGFGRVGQLLGRILDCENMAYVALDRDGSAIQKHRQRGLPVIYGDASRPEMLARAHAGTAGVIVVTMDDPSASEHVVRCVSGRWPHVPVCARARDPEQARRLRAMGATDVVPETLEAGLQLGASLLRTLGLPDEAAVRRIELARQSELDDVSAG